MRSIFRTPSDDVAGDAKRRVPIHYYIRRKHICWQTIIYIPVSAMTQVIP